VPQSVKRPPVNRLRVPCVSRHAVNPGIIRDARCKRRKTAQSKPEA
jgi:hypothetical protein